MRRGVGSLCCCTEASSRSISRRRALRPPATACRNSDSRSDRDRRRQQDQRRGDDADRGDTRCCARDGDSRPGASTDATIDNAIDQHSHRAGARPGVADDDGDVFDIAQAAFARGRSDGPDRDTDEIRPLAPLTLVIAHPVTTKMVSVDQPRVESAEDLVRHARDLVIDDDHRWSQQSVAEVRGGRWTEPLDRNRPADRLDRRTDFFDRGNQRRLIDTSTAVVGPAGGIQCIGATKYPRYSLSVEPQLIRHRFELTTNRPRSNLVCDSVDGVASPRVFRACPKPLRLHS